MALGRTRSRWMRASVRWGRSEHARPRGIHCRAGPCPDRVLRPLSVGGAAPSGDQQARHRPLPASPDVGGMEMGGGSDFVDPQARKMAGNLWAARGADGIWRLGAGVDPGVRSDGRWRSRRNAPGPGFVRYVAVLFSDDAGATQLWRLCPDWGAPAAS